MVRIFVCLFLWLFSFFSTLSAQTLQNLTLSGKTDPGKNRQLEINLFSAENKLVKTELADADGNFSFSDLASGNYFIKINRNGSEVYAS